MSGRSERYKHRVPNPYGQPKPWDTFASILKELAEGPWPPTADFDQGSAGHAVAKRHLCRVMFVKAAGGDLAATNWIVERVEGKVPDVVQMTANVSNDSPVREEEVTAFRDWRRATNGSPAR